MPESYLHVRCARGAYRESGARGYDISALVAGCAGPDIFFYHMGIPPLVRLGQKMHAVGCGPFLTALTRCAVSRTERSYALGFLTHNATDAVFHPWIAREEGSHAALEQAMDSHYLLRDKGRATVRPDDCAAALCGEKALEIGRLVSRCLEEVYGVAVSPRAVARALGDFRRWKRLLRDTDGRKARHVARLERMLKLEPGYLAGHLITGTPMGEDARADALAREAEALGATLMGAALAHWRGEIGPLELAREIGNRSYMTGESL